MLVNGWFGRMQNACGFCFNLTICCDIAELFYYAEKILLYFTSPFQFLGLLFMLISLSINSSNQSAPLNVASGSPVTRWASVAFGAGVGIGSAYSECGHKFNTSSPKLTPYVSHTSLPKVCKWKSCFYGLYLSPFLV